jgi:ribosomal protein RSM22 (predicted rRNA methylase)
MQLPSQLQLAIEKEVAHVKASELLKARKELSERYRDESVSSFMQTEGMRLSYLVTRLPATFAVFSKVLFYLCEQIADLKIESFLDLGAGPGGALWAIKEKFPELTKATLVEKDPAMILLGKRLTSPFSCEWQQNDLEHKQSFAKHHLVLLSYSLGELSSAARNEVLKAAFLAADPLLLIIEPGTPKGYERILEARQALLLAKGHLVAPCPHELPCPLSTNDWCHFSTRVERSSLHRQIKEADLGYEDEKFSYLIFSKRQVCPCSARVLRHPQKRSGHVRLTLCAKEGFMERVVSKKNPHYKKARDLEWGDCFSE